MQTCKLGSACGFSCPCVVCCDQKTSVWYVHAMFIRLYSDVGRVMHTTIPRLGVRLQMSVCCASEDGGVENHARWKRERRACWHRALFPLDLHNTSRRCGVSHIKTKNLGKVLTSSHNCRPVEKIPKESKTGTPSATRDTTDW